MAVYFIGLKTGYSEKALRTLTFVTLIASNIAIIISNRSWTANFFRIILTPNKSVKWVVGGATLFLILVLNIPFLLNLFQFERIGMTETTICILAGFVSIAWFEAYKHFKLGKNPL
jgi:P-type Ca2+ transporter type 2C